MNSPFDYTPSAAMMAAREDLVAHITTMCAESEVFAADVAKGKMFGILLTDCATLYAFSGQIGGSFHWRGFVPPVFDYLDHDGYFKTRERGISALNLHIAQMESDSRLLALRAELHRQKAEADADIEAYRQQMQRAKHERDLLRENGTASGRDLVRESQHMKAELHRKRQQWKTRLEALGDELEHAEGEIRLLRLMRQHMSDSLQRWLFSRFVFAMPDGGNRTLTDIFREHLTVRNSSLLWRGIAVEAAIPSGSGECCEPKLLHHAFAHGLQPVEIGMFWWGESPRHDVRRHLQFYPACEGKCRPILEAMLPETCRKPVATYYHGGCDSLRVLFEDSHIIAVSKPAGMLSVPGRDAGESVMSILAETHPDDTCLQSVHRLDMDTSGILLVAKTAEARKSLQRQFALHTLKKEYVALLEGSPAESSGVVSLPLGADYADRPRQKVDRKEGKEAVTRYECVDGVDGWQRVRLFPLTGRTHQLRVPCAHDDGLACPIRGDRLYGTPADRLYLHATRIEFAHPATGQLMTIEDPPEW